MGKLRNLLLMIIFQVTFIFTGMAENMPHTFVSGGTASASQVNENFSYLLNKVGMKKVYADGGYIGETHAPLKGFFDNSSLIVVYLDTGYSIYLKSDGILYQSEYLYYKSTDCSGTPYFRWGDNTYLYLQPARGKILLDAGQLLYVKHNATLYSSTMSSRKYSTGSCSTSGVLTGVFSIAQLNDPSETGIDTYPFSTPITIDGFTTATTVED